VIRQAEHNIEETSTRNKKPMKRRIAIENRPSESKRLKELLFLVLTLSCNWLFHGWRENKNNNKITSLAPPETEVAD
jgi:hypothetical protein